ncbi:hypothetical protein [Actinomadura opuntiae]|uniref:hypothetical protein n=1 Tax=Actinomadura sp. OS1-43 TaxID=604315 RepID=UPI00255AA2E4|nr:hypothetical protein [Actinomadura sp. OS1-43]MDL4814546.1 hypothetical protein [Actinomadura sp. OS1-43]
MRLSLRRRLQAGAASLAVTGGLLGGLATGPAASAGTLPSFDFSACPALPSGADPAYAQCNVAVTTGGTMQLGSIKETISSPITLTYTTGFDPVTLEEYTIFGSFKASRFQVQPGLFGDPFVTAIYAQPQYAGGLNTDGGTLNLNLKVNVQNPLLGSRCYIGSNANPIALHLTPGTTNPPPPNTPISGTPPEVVGTNPTVLKTTVVDNAFAVPKADGCGLDLGVENWAVDLYAGLPSAAGHNTAIFNQYVAYKTYTELP